MASKKSTPTPAKPKIAESFAVNLAEVALPSVDATIVRKQKDDFVHYGINNGYPDLLIDYVSKSDNHSGFIHLRENVIKGKSLSYSDALKTWFDQMAEDGTAIEDLWANWSTDMSILETFACLVRYNADHTHITLDFVDSSKVRPSKTFELDADGVETSKISGYWVSGDWSNIRLNEPKFFPRFDPAKTNEKVQLHFYHKRAPGQPWLPVVSYRSCLNYVLQEYEMSKYGLNTMLNGFFASAIMTVMASMTDEQAQAFKNSVKNTFQGSENASKLMVMVSPDKDSVNVQPLTTGDNTPMLEALSLKAQQAIATAHRCNAALAAVSTSTGFNSEAALLRSAQEQFQNNVITALQEPMIAFLKRVAKFNGFEEFDFSVNSLNLVSETTPDWFLQDRVKTEVLAARWGFKKEDILADFLTPDVVTPAEPTAAPVEPAAPSPATKSPYPADVTSK